MNHRQALDGAEEPRGYLSPGVFNCSYLRLPHSQWMFPELSFPASVNCRSTLGPLTLLGAYGIYGKMGVSFFVSVWVFGITCVMRGQQ